MSTSASSLQQCLDAEGDRAVGLTGADVDAHQLDMLRDDKGALPGNVFQQVRQQARGPGRPKGSPNKRNKKLAQMIIAQHGDPVLGMASLYSTPLDQLVEMLKIADGAPAREERLIKLVERCEGLIAAACRTGLADKEEAKTIAGLLERIEKISAGLQWKPGQMALQALALQLQARAKTAEYVHGKQPVAIDVNGKADLTLIVPGLAGVPDDVPIDQLEEAVRKGGLAALEEGDFTIVGDDDEDDGEDPADD